MLLRHSLSVLLGNYKLTIKVLIISAILSIIAIAVFVAVFNPILEAIGADANFEKGMAEILDQLAKGEGNIVDEVFARVEYSLNNSGVNVTGAIAGSIAVIVILKILFAFMSVGAGYVVYCKMCSGCETGYLNAMVSTFAKAVPYALINTAVTVPADIGITIGIYYLAKVGLAGLGIVGLILSLCVYLLVATARITIIGQIIPVMLQENIGFFKAFVPGIRKSAKAFKETYPVLLVLVICAFGIIAVSVVPTVGILPIALMPVMLVQYICVNLVVSFRLDNKKYYLDEHVVEAETL